MDNSTNTANAINGEIVQPSVTKADPAPLAMEMKLRGLRYAYIAEELQRAGFTTTEMTLAQWFSSDGKLFKEYQERKAQRLLELQKQMEEKETLFQDAAMEAFTMLKNSITRDNLSDQQIKVCQDILDRAGYARQIKQEVSGKIETTGMEELALAVRQIAESIK